MRIVNSLANLSFDIINAKWSQLVTSVSPEVRRLKKVSVEEGREDEMIQFLFRLKLFNFDAFN